jgi:hypothetical protein
MRKKIIPSTLVFKILFNFYTIRNYDKILIIQLKID